MLLVVEGITKAATDGLAGVAVRPASKCDSGAHRRLRSVGLTRQWTRVAGEPGERVT